jgi:acyl carrier protein phosphodiesterase
MNYLAHLYLSGEEHHVIVGNFIGDAVKGNMFENYPDKIKAGVLLHRQIDSFTDRHPIVKEAKAFFANSYGRYSGVVIDLLFDHFLASKWDKYHDESLSEYVTRINMILLANFGVLPHRIKLMMPFWVKHRWPELYVTINGLLRVLNGMTNYTSMPQKVEQFKKEYDDNTLILSRLFDLFFKELKNKFSK